MKIKNKFIKDIFVSIISHLYLINDIMLQHTDVTDVENNVSPLKDI